MKISNYEFIFFFFQVWLGNEKICRKEKKKRKKQANYLNIASALQLHFQLNYRLNWKG